MKVFAYIGIGLLALVAIAALSIGGSSMNYWLNKTFSPLNEQVRRATFEQSQAYNEGMRRDLENLHDQYLSTTDPAAKAALADTFKHRAYGYPNQLPADLQSFLNSLRG